MTCISNTHYHSDHSETTNNHREDHNIEPGLSGLFGGKPGLLLSGYCPRKLPRPVWVLLGEGEVGTGESVLRYVRKVHQCTGLDEGR